MSKGSGPFIFGAAAIVGAAVLAGSFMLAGSLDRVGEKIESSAVKLDEIKIAVADAKDALSKLQAAPAQVARSGPDPNKRYKLNTKDSPALGPEDAAVTVVAFSDFQ